MFALRSKLLIGAASMAFIIGSFSMAMAAAIANFSIQNSTGVTISRSAASCTSGSISAPATITNGNTANFSGTTTDNTFLCTVRYDTPSGTCQFRVQVTASGGFALANLYAGSGGCDLDNEFGSGGSYTGIFTHN